MENKMFNDILDSIINNADEEEIEIIREKLNNHLINHIYESQIHEELSNDFDSSLCPLCGCHHTKKHGYDKKGNQRYQCKECGKTFSAITGFLLSYSKKEAYQWYLYIESLFNGDTIKQSALITGICEQTSLVWRHKLLSICAALTDKGQMLEDTVYLDEKVVNVNQPGQEYKKPRPKTKRGMSDQKRNIACAIDEHNHKIVQVSEVGRIHSDELIRIYKDRIPSTCTLVTDSLRSYHKFTRELDVKWIKIDSGKTEKDGYTLDKVNHLHSAIDLFLYKYRGISDKYLKNYIGLFKLKDQYQKYYRKDIFLRLVTMIFNSLCELKFNDFRSSFSFSSL